MIRKWRIYAEKWTFFYSILLEQNVFISNQNIYISVFRQGTTFICKRISTLVWNLLMAYIFYILLQHSSVSVWVLFIFTQFFCGYEFKEYEYLVSAPDYTKLFDNTLLQWRHMSNFITMTPHECYGVINHWHLDILRGQWCRQSFHVMTLHEWSICWPLRSILRPLSSCIGSLWRSICSEFACQVLYVYGFCNYIHYNVWN